MDVITHQVCKQWRIDKVHLKTGGDRKYLLVGPSSETGFRLAKMVAGHKGNDDVAPMFRGTRRLAGKVPETLVSDGTTNFGHAHKQYVTKNFPNQIMLLYCSVEELAMMPTFQGCMLPILKICESNQGYRTWEMEKKLAGGFSLTEEEKGRLLPSGTQTVLYNRTTWAMFELRNAGLLARENHVYCITKDGKDVLSKKPAKIDRKFLMTIPRYRKWKETVGQDKPKKDGNGGGGDPRTPTEMIEAGYESIKQSVEQDLLKRIKTNPPEFFERLVVNLMRKMGYGIDDQVTGKTGDGGIDGVIWEDEFRFNALYLQAKRWEAAVPIDAVRSFGGSLAIQKSQKGVIITTSSFPRSAYEYVKQSNYKIILIDGHKLTEYMYKHDLGVIPEDSYTIKKVDASFFE